MQKNQKNLLRLLVASGLVSSSAYAATNTVNFNAAGGALPFAEVGATAGEYRADGGASGAAGDGYLSITDARSGQRSSLVFNDLDAGLVVKAFVFEADLRIGGGTARPADGFSLNYVRSTDAIIQNGGPYAGTAGETDLPEEGSLTGLGIGFDTWQSGDHPGGITDVVGISLRVDGQLITQLPVPLRPGNVWPGGTFDEVPFRNLATNNANYASSMQTGALSDEDLNGDGSVTAADADAGQPAYADDPVVWAKWVKNLKWEKLRAEITEDARLKLSWKGVELTPAGGLATTFAPSPGRLVFGGRTGGAWEVHHVDNLYLATVPADNIIIGAAVGNPIGFTLTSVDSGSGIAVTDGFTVTLNGTAVTPQSVTKDGITLTAVYGNAAAPLASGSVNTVVATVRDTLGRTVTETRQFTVAPYVTVPPSYAVANASGSGFNFRIHQTAQRGQPNTIARAEQQLQGLRGANVADLGLATAGVFNVPVINFNQPDAAAAPQQSGWFDSNETNPDRQIADTLIPGIPSATEFNADSSYYTDNMAAEITTYLQFPTAGVYQLIFNSDDGFRTTVGGNNAEVLSSLIVSEADFGKGDSDVVATVYVPTAGFYPFRSVWFEGGGGANLEWSAMRVAPNPTARYLINDANPNAIKAFRTTTASLPAAVSFVHPARGTGGAVPGTVPLIVDIKDGATAVSQGSIELLLNGTAVAATKTPSGGTTRVQFDPPGNLAGGSVNQVIVRFTAGTQTYSATNSFTVSAAPVVAPSLALPASAVNTANRGFLVKTVQQANGESMGNDTYRGLTHIAGMIGTENVADLTAFTGPSGYFVETGVINYNQTAGSSGFFPDDTGVPGIPGTTSSTDNFAQEILTVLNLTPGYYMFNVNSDDGFVMTIGNPAEAFTLPLVVGEFSGGRGNGGGIADGTTYAFEVTQAGLYPVRLVWYEGGGGANVEFSARQFDPVTGALQSGNLINADGGITAYQYPLATAGVPYVKSFAPARTGRASGVAPYRAGTDAAVTLVVPQGTGPALNTANVSLTVDGTAVTPTVTTAGGNATISYAPAGGWVADSTHVVRATIIDRTVSWTFGVGAHRTPTFFIEAEDFDNGGNGIAAASVMPYAGGAYAGVTAVASTDYTRNNEDASPIYRTEGEPNIPMDRTGDRDRGLGEIAVNYKIGWAGGDGWYNYTRTFPAGRYNVYAGLSHGDGPASATRMAATLSTVTGGTATTVGTFDAPATGGWGNNALVPLKASNTDTTPLAVELSGSKTLRFQTGNGDFDFILFSPVAAEPPTITSIVRNANGSVTITYSGGTLQAAPAITGPFTDVAGATSPFTFTPDQPMLFGRVRQ
jgi:hypothetical protein